MDWKSIVGVVAPTLATALGGPLAGMAATIAGRVLLGTDNASVKDIAAAVQGATPETMLKLKEIEAELIKQERELDFSFADLEVKDRVSARNRETAQGIVGLVGTHVLAVFVLAMFALAVYWVFKGQIPNSTEYVMLIGSVVGYLAANSQQVLSYFFGSSSGSARRTEALSEAMTTVANARANQGTGSGR